MPRKKGFHHSEETKKKIGNSNRGKKRSSATKEAMSQSKRGKPRPDVSERNRQRTGTHSKHPYPRRSVSDRFWEKVNIRGPNDCWPWTAATTWDYGQFWYRPRGKTKGKNYRAHRIAFRLAYGHWPVPQANHICDNKACCNPFHIYEGTSKENARDRSQSEIWKQACKRMAAMNKGKTLSDETKAKLSRAAKEQWARGDGWAQKRRK